jgi:hypothetical protein
MYVVYATHWCASGYGRTSLSVKELRSRFDLRLWMLPIEALGEQWLIGGVFMRMAASTALQCVSFYSYFMDGCLDKMFLTFLLNHNICP